MNDCAVLDTLACPCDRKRGLRRDDDAFYCAEEGCSRIFPVVGGIPILINEDSSVFNIRDVLSRRARDLEVRPVWPTRIRRVGKRLVRYVPAIGANWKAKQNIRRLRHLLFEWNEHSVVLIIGSGEGDSDLETNLSSPRITLLRSDVYFAPDVDMIADSHDLPFQTASFDAVVCQSVLEHVVDPCRCVNEIHRVLRPRGIVYAEIPFMQQVHAKAYDFTRFTLGGLRRLFRRFEIIDAGVEGGPGMTLAWSVSWFFKMLSSSVVMEAFVYFVLPFFIFWLKYIDYLFVNSPRAADGASELYFLGRRSDAVTSDRQIVSEYWLQQAK
jgi:SAM-dependent methyltransferase/uncharacterized protein YbaR (Trm112 family)